MNENERRFGVDDVLDVVHVVCHFDFLRFVFLSF